MILASSSPRRRELLQQLGISFTVVPADIDETPVQDENPTDYVCRMAIEKAREVAKREDRSAEWVLGGDTSVVADNRILGKPKDRADFASMMRMLSGKQHQVISAFALVKDDHEYVESQKTLVWFRELSEADIDAYWSSGEPCDRAGGYAIQGLGAIFVERIDGSFSSVMGLPVFEVARALKTHGIL